MVERALVRRKVLRCFESMGATREQLREERLKLRDDDYLGAWVETCTVRLSKPERLWAGLGRIISSAFFLSSRKRF